MFDAISELILYKIQSHDDSHFKFKRTGVHRIAGDNSNGKSVAFKACDALFFGEGINKEGRNSLISVGSDFGIISASSFNGINLTLYLHLESKHSFYKLTIRNKDGVEESIVKYLIDDYRELLKIANFHWMQDEGYSLNRYKTKTALPFTHFTGTMNYKVLDSASENPKFTQMLEIIDENYKEVRMDREMNERRVIAMKEQLKSLDDSNLKEVETTLLKLKSLQKSYNVLETLYLPIKELVKIEEEIDTIDTIDVSHYTAVRPILDTLDQMILSLNNLIEIEDKIVQHDKNTKQPVIDLHHLFSSLEKAELLVVLTDEIQQVSTDLQQHRDLEVIELDNIIDNVETVMSLKENLGDMVKSSEGLEYVDDTILVDVSPVLNNIYTLKTLQDTLDTIINFSEQLEELNAKEFELVDVSELIDTLTEMELIGLTLNELESKAVKLDEVDENDMQLVEIDNLLDCIPTLENVSSSIANIIKYEEELSSVKVIECEDITPILDLLDIIKGMQSNVVDLVINNEEIGLTKYKAEKLMKECEKLAQEIGICSSCGNLRNKHKEVC